MREHISNSLLLRWGLSLAIMATLHASCAQKKTPPTNVLLITVDTLRPDHLACYGNSKVKTPNFDRLAREGVLFQDAFCQVPLTLPSHASILSGTYPMSHGFRDQGQTQSNRKMPSLAGVLRQEGYRTAAFVGSFVLDSRFGLNQGFDYYFDRFETSLSGAKEFQNVERPASDVANEAIQWIGSTPEKKFFAWIHLYDPHDPYLPPEPFKTEYQGNPYDGEIAFVDSVLGKLFALLEEKGLYDNTLIVLLSDHGEGLEEHGETYHGFFVYDSTLRIPLLVKPPRGFNSKNQIIQEQVETVDIAPTILEFLKLSPRKEIQGRSLLSTIQGKRLVSPSKLYGESYYPRQFDWSELRTLRSGKYKFIEAPKPELFDTDQDPHELRNLALEHPETVKAMLGDLRQLSERFPKESAIDQKNSYQSNAEVRRKLSSLGYMSGSRSNFGLKATEPSNLPDPKDKLDVYQRFQKALLASGKGDPNTAASELESVLRLDPQFTEARLLLGMIQRNQGQQSLAQKSFLAIVKQRPSHAAAHYNLALTCLFLGQRDEAEAHLRKVIEIDPAYSDAYADLGGIYQSKGRTDDAVLQYQTCLQISPLDYQALNNLAAIYLSRDSDREAVTLLERVVKANPSRFEAYNNLGSAYLKLKKFDQALVEFGRAQQLNPDYGPVQANIGLVYMAQGRIDEAKEQFTRSLRLDPADRAAREYLRMIESGSALRR